MSRAAAYSLRNGEPLWIAELGRADRPDLIYDRALAEGEPIRFEGARDGFDLEVRAVTVGEEEGEEEDGDDDNDDRLYSDEWYRHSAVAAAMNEALEEAGASRRIYTLPSEDHEEAFLVVTPAVAERLKRADVPISLVDEG